MRAFTGWPHWQAKHSDIAAFHRKPLAVARGIARPDPGPVRLDDAGLALVCRPARCTRAAFVARPAVAGTKRSPDAGAEPAVPRQLGPGPGAAIGHRHRGVRLAHRWADARQPGAGRH